MPHGTLLQVASRMKAPRMIPKSLPLDTDPGVDTGFRMRSCAKISPSNACPNFKHAFETEFRQKSLRIGRDLGGSGALPEAFLRVSRVLGRHLARCCHDATGTPIFDGSSSQPLCRVRLAAARSPRYIECGFPLNPRSHDPGLRFKAQSVVSGSREHQAESE
jgi:hypothetical protein